MYLCNNSVEDKILYAIAFGDSLGVPYENLSKKTINKISFLKRKQNLFHNITSDDTDHALMTLQTYKKTKNIEEFENILRKRILQWTFTMPLSIGKATLISSIKMMFGLKKGINSAGNGGIMRSIILGSLISNHEDLWNYTSKSTSITHTHELAIFTSYASAIIIKNILDKKIILDNSDCRKKIIHILRKIPSEHPMSLSTFEEWEKYIYALETDNLNTLFHDQYISGYCMNTLFSAIYFSIKNEGNAINATRDIILMGGDTDSNAMLASAFCFDFFIGQNMNVRIVNFLDKSWFKEVVFRTFQYFVLILKRIYWRYIL